METKFVPAILVILLTLACVVTVIIGLNRSLKFTPWPVSNKRRLFSKSIIVIALWVVLIGVLSSIGFFRVTDAMPPRPVVMILFSLLAAVMIARSKTFSELLSSTPLHWLVYIQSFRIFVELILWQGYVKGLLPVQMTFEGYNYDILSGIFAIPAGWMMNRNLGSARVIGIFYNLLGIALLMNILTIAVLSMPTPLRYFMNEPSNLVVGEFPFIYIPGVFVVLAIFMHIFSLRQLSLLKKRMPQV